MVDDVFYSRAITNQPPAESRILTSLDPADPRQTVSPTFLFFWLVTGNLPLRNLATSPPASRTLEAVDSPMKFGVLGMDGQSGGPSFCFSDSVVVQSQRAVFFSPWRFGLLLNRVVRVGLGLVRRSPLVQSTNPSNASLLAQSVLPPIGERDPRKDSHDSNPPGWVPSPVKSRHHILCTFCQLLPSKKSESRIPPPDSYPVVSTMLYPRHNQPPPSQTRDISFFLV